MGLSWASLPFIFHIIVEAPAGLSFLLRPSGTLDVLQPHAHAVIRQYAILLTCTNIIAGIFAMQDYPNIHSAQIERGVSASLALYHCGPASRALSRFQRGSKGSLLVNPLLHIAAHVMCASALMGRAVDWW